MPKNNDQIQDTPAVLTSILPYLWPSGKHWVKRRVVASLFVLLFAKILTVSIPFFYKAAVDILSMTADPSNPAFMLALGGGWAGGGLWYYADLLGRIRPIARCYLCTGWATRPASVGVRDFSAYPPPIPALSYHAQNRRIKPSH